MARPEQLDLFADLPAPGSTASGAMATAPGMDPHVPGAAQDIQVSDGHVSRGKSPESGALPVSITPPSVLPDGMRWREVSTPQQTIGFLLRRSRRRSIGLSVDDGGLLVTAPNWVTLRQIDDAVIEKSRWIVRKLRERHERKAQQATAETLWLQDGQLPYMGQRITLRLGGVDARPWFTGRPFAPATGDQLVLGLPASADPLRVRDSTYAWLQQQAQAWLGARLQHFLDANGLAVRRWRLSSAATRWGSCSSDGNIMLNWRLIHFRHDVIDYVIAHEVAHLRYLNHSADFWREVGRILPGFEAARDVLRRHDPASLPLI